MYDTFALIAILSALAIATAFFLYMFTKRRYLGVLAIVIAVGGVAGIAYSLTFMVAEDTVVRSEDRVEGTAWEVVSIPDVELVARGGRGVQYEFSAYVKDGDKIVAKTFPLSQSEIVPVELDEGQRIVEVHVTDTATWKDVVGRTHTGEWERSDPDYVIYVHLDE